MGDIDTPEHSVTNLRLIAKWLADDGLTDPAAFLVRLASKLPELEQDAARLDWLSSQCVPGIGIAALNGEPRQTHYMRFPVVECEAGATLRAAIDAARKGKGHG